MPDIISKIMDAGCAACYVMGWATPAQEFHHLHTKGKRRAGKKIGIGLCTPHHRDTGTPGFTSRHPWKRRFESEYGSEWDLYDQTLTRIGANK